jgi:hypothetical protein
MESKQALKLAKKLKAAQALAYPSKKYKQQLFTRLENIHLVDQAEDVTPRFSLYQIFGALASFCFIAGSVFMLFEVRQNSQNPLYHEFSEMENTSLQGSGTPIPE